MSVLSSSFAVLAVSGVVYAVVASGCGAPEHDADHDHGVHTAAAAAGAPAEGNPYPGHCPVMGGEVDLAKAATDPTLWSDHGGKRYYFCCANCKPKFDKDPAKWIASPAKPSDDGHAH